MWFFAEVLEGIQDALLARDLDLTLYDARPRTPGRERIFEQFLARKRVDGLIAVGLEPGDDGLQRILAIDKPVVSIVGEGTETSVIEVDDDDAARRATEHLIALGHRGIAFLGGGGGAATGRRWTGGGCVGTRLDDGCRPGRRHRAHPLAGHLPGGYAAAVDMLGDARTRPTAVVAVCDEVAIGAIIAARLSASGFDGSSVVGIDDHEFAEMFSLTTLQQVPREQGRRGGSAARPDRRGGHAAHLRAAAMHGS